jgi:hypothetical protein
MRRLVLALLVCAGLPGCGGVTISESGKHFAEKSEKTPSSQEVEATINRFERKAFGPGHEQVAACESLTARSFRELMVGSGAKYPGRLDTEAFEKGCPVGLAIIAKETGEKAPTIKVEKVSKEEFEGRFVLVAELPEEFLFGMNSAGTKIETFGIAAAEEREKEAEEGP